MTKRERLGNRRRHDVFEFEHLNIRYRAGVGYFDDGRKAEFFLDAGHVGSAVNVQARDMAVTASLALQCGCSIETLRHALTKLQDGRGAGPLGHLLDLIEPAECGAAGSP